MRRPRPGLTLAAVVAACLAVFVPSAAAIDPFPTGGVQTLSSEHFMVHYSADDEGTTCTNFITQQKAGDVLGMLERAYSLYGSWGYPAPLADSGSGDALIDVSIDDFPKACIPYGAISLPGLLDRWDALIEPVAPTGAGEVHLNSSTALNYHLIAHEVFHLVEDAMAPGTDQWLQEGTAEWAATRANFAANGDEHNPDRPMDCLGSHCGDTEYDKNGYPGWMLFEYLAERYGDGKVREVWNQAAASAPGTLGRDILASVLPISLGTFFNDYTTARLTGSFSFGPLAGVLPEAHATVSVGDTTGALAGTPLAVNHLAVRYLTFSHGSDPTAPCFAATLTINVAIPAGVASTPHYYAHTKDATAQALTITGSNASISVPWNTCAGSPDAYLSLPNDSFAPDLDGREFVVTGSVTVDRSKPASPTEPPAPVKVVGGVVVVPTTDPAPTLRVYAPEVLRVSSKTRLLRFAVFSSGDGKLQAALGSTGLGTATLRGGNNDIRFVLPQQLFKRLRTKSTSNVLELTSVSPSGTKGSTVTRRVLVQIAKPKPKKRR